MTRRAGIRSLVLAGSILLAVLVAVWLGARRTGHAIDEANTIEPAGGPSMPRPGSTGGVRRLQIDPAMPSLEWRREGFDEPEPSFVALNDALRSIAGTTDAAALEELLAMLAWTMPFGQDGEVGLAISECAKRFEPQLAEACRWDMDFVVERTAGDLGELRLARATRSSNDFGTFAGSTSTMPHRSFATTRCMLNTNCASSNACWPPTRPETTDGSHVG